VSRYVRWLALFLFGVAVGVAGVLAIGGAATAGVSSRRWYRRSHVDTARFLQHVREGWIITSRPTADTGVDIYCMERPLLPSAH
jgi:hypothetical protein